MITDDGIESSGDVQPQEAGGADDDYAKPFGTSESKAETLGFLESAPTVKPRDTSRLVRLLRRLFPEPRKP
jgi:hypothetical protein